MISVLFVCLGNICRSPMADAIFQHLVREAGLQHQITVDSAGTGSWHIGEQAHHGTRDVLQQHGIPYDGRARQFKPADLARFDYVLAMDSSNLANIQRHNAVTAEVQMFLHYAKQAGTVDVINVPDPYYDGEFDAVYELVYTGAVALLAHIRHAEGL